MAINDNNLVPSDQTFALFEGSSIKQFIIEQLNKGGIFVDQNYLGSNLNAFIDIIAVMLQQLLFHYNNTASESTFATAGLFENMNKLVSLFNYKPAGKQTSILPVKYNINLANASDKTGTFLIPRYSFINYNKSFFVKDDITFVSSANSQTTVNSVVYQGNITESDVYILDGEDFQTISLIDRNIKLENGKFIADNFFDVYVREPGGKWSQYKEVNSLFENTSLDKVYERRLNENYNYEFKFGNGINGYNPKNGSEVVIFYIISDGSTAEIGDNLLENTQLFLYNSTKFNEIILDTATGIFDTLPKYIDPVDLKYITVNNIGPSTPVTAIETPDMMRNNVPKLFSSQNRLITKQDYITYINKIFRNFIKDCYVFNNDEYTGTYLKYFYDIGLKAPNDDSRVLLNQVTFQNSCAFNNIYIILLPLINTIIEDKVPNYVNTNLKQYLSEQLQPYKDIAHNIAIIDPVYKAVSFGIVRDKNNSLPEHFEDVRLVLTRDKYSNFSGDYITSEAVTIFEDYFNNVKLGDSIDLSGIMLKLVQIPGVTDVYMTDGTNISDKLTFAVWNPLYEESDLTITQQNILLRPFMYHYFYDLKNINSKISVISE